MNNQFKYKQIAFAILMAFPLFGGATPLVPPGDVRQTSINEAAVKNTTNTAVDNIGITDDAVTISLGTGASASITATGAAASVSISAINGALPTPTVDGVPLDNITQTATNSGAVTNNGLLFIDMNSDIIRLPLSIELNGGSLGVGAPTSISATGAAASVSVSAINDGSYATSGVLTGFDLPAIGMVSHAGGLQNGQIAETTYAAFVGAPIPQITNGGEVINNGVIDGVGVMNIGSSASISAAGAAASYSVSAVSVEFVDNLPVSAINVVAANLGPVVQAAQNTGSINNTGVITFAESAEMANAASVSVSATGAVASVSQSFVNANLVTETGWTLGDILQGANNTGIVTNDGTITGASTYLSQAASAAVSATGAVVAVSFSGVNNTLALPDVESGFSVTQFVSNEGAITNTGSISSLSLLGAGASASVSATGAAASISFNGNNTTLTTQIIGSVAQTAINDGSVSNSGAVTTGPLDQGASASVSATGAVASLAMSANGGTLAGETAAFQNVTQTVTNLGNVTNQASTINTSNLDAGASAAISATGALAAISLSTVNATVTDSVALAGNYSQTVTNGEIVEGDSIGNISNSGSVVVSNLANGASASVSATGAVASLSVSAINSTAKFSTVTGSIDQTVLNKATVTNTGGVTAGTLADGASVAVSAAGAVASISMSATFGTVSSGAALGTVGTDGADIYQNAGNNIDVTNASGTFANGSADTVGVSAGNLEGVGASAAISATGAVTSTSFNFNDTSLTTAPFTLAAITQDANSSGALSNTGVMSVGGLIGSGASASISATGAVASVAYSANAATITDSGVTFGAVITQTSTNNNNIVNAGDLTLGVMSGSGVSASISATGAVASVAYSSNNSRITDSDVSFNGAITQTVTSTGSVTNTGELNVVFLSGQGEISGTGASASISATGAAASVGYSANSLDIWDSKVTFVGVDQTAENIGAITNTGTLTAGDISGRGASASISATGAVASTSYSSNFSDINATETGLSRVTFSGAITQDANSTGAISNTGTLTAGDLSATGAGASISASGAVASVAYSANDSTVTNSNVTFSAPITQTATNNGTVNNTGTLTAGDISGTGASVSISASGAVASTAYSTSGSTVDSTNVTFNGSILQTANNYAAITNNGNLTLGTLSGTGASASISATGAVSSFSVASIADTNLVGSAALGGAFIQSATNTAAVTNTGVINFSGGAVTLGSGASAAVSATGAVTSISFSNVK